MRVCMIRYSVRVPTHDHADWGARIHTGHDPARVGTARAHPNDEQVEMMCKASHLSAIPTYSRIKVAWQTIVRSFGRSVVRSFGRSVVLPFFR